MAAEPGGLPPKGCYHCRQPGAVLSCTTACCSSHRDLLLALHMRIIQITYHILRNAFVCAHCQILTLSLSLTLTHSLAKLDRPTLASRHQKDQNISLSFVHKATRLHRCVLHSPPCAKRCQTWVAKKRSPGSVQLAQESTTTCVHPWSLDS